MSRKSASLRPESPPPPELHIAIGFEKGSAFECPEEGCSEKCKVHDTQERTWRHLNFFQYKTFIHARVPRIRCERHGVKTVDVLWASPLSGFTFLFEAFALELSKSMPVSEAARIMNEKRHETLEDDKEVRRDRKEREG